VLISNIGLDLIKEFEGFVPYLYNDPVNATIGYGFLLHLGLYHEQRGVCSLCDQWPRKRETAKWLTEEEGLVMLRAKVSVYAGYVEQQTHVPLNQNQFDAMTSFCYNVGPGGYGSSTVLGVINAGRYQDVCWELKRYVRGTDGVVYPGLVRRRQAECDLFSAPVVEEEEEMKSLQLMHVAGAFQFLASDVYQGYPPNQAVCQELLSLMGNGPMIPLQTRQQAVGLLLYSSSEALRGNPLNDEATQKVRWLLKTRPILAG